MSEEIKNEILEPVSPEPVDPPMADAAAEVAVGESTEAELPAAAARTDDLHVPPSIMPEEAPAAETASESPVSEIPAVEAAAVEPAIIAEVPESAEPAERRWFIIFAKAGYENRVRVAIEERINSTDLGQKVFRVLVPEEEIIELRQNRRVERMKKMFPGYVFVEMILNEETWYRIRSIPGVSRFIGAHKMPVPVAEKEMQRVLRQIGMKEETQIETDFEKGEGIRIISGPFRGYVGTIEECHPEKGKLRAFISIFGRDTPVELDFSQIERG